MVTLRLLRSISIASFPDVIRALQFIQRATQDALTAVSNPQQINGVNVTNAPTGPGQVLTSTSTTEAHWV